MDLKINNISFSSKKIPTTTQNIHRYTGIPNFKPRYYNTLNPKQSFFTKVCKFFKALYYANFK